MAKNSDFTGNYAGEKAIGYVAPAVLSANTIAQGAVTVHENIRYKLNVRNFASTGFLQAADCDFSSSGTVALSDVVLEPTELMVNLELCKKDFQTQWESLEMRGALLAQEIPTSFQDYLIERLNALTAKDVETKIWQGAANSGGDFIGLESRLLGDSSVNDVVGTTLTAANIIAELAKVVSAIPSAVYADRAENGVAIRLSIKAAQLYQRALGYGQLTATPNFINSYNNQLTVGEKPLNFEGIPLIVCNGLSDNKMVAGRSADLHFGTNVLTDMTSIDIIDRAPIDGSQNFRYVQRFTAGTQITNGTDLVYYA